MEGRDVWEKMSNIVKTCRVLIMLCSSQLILSNSLIRCVRESASPSPDQSGEDLSPGTLLGSR